MNATNEASTLLNNGKVNTALPSSSPLEVDTSWVRLLLLATAGATLLFVAISFMSRQGHDTLQDANLRSLPLLSRSAAMPLNDCVSIMTGVFDSACMVVGGEFAFPNGILGGLVLGAPSLSDGGIDYYLLSVDNAYLGPLYLEHGHYTLNDMTAPVNATNNCAGRNDLEYKFIDDKGWSPLTLEMEWNSDSGGESFLLGTNNGFSCHYVKLSSGECSKVYKDIVKAFSKDGMDLHIPSLHHLCK